MQPANLIDSVEVVREIGKGGFGVVYLVKDPAEKLFALKKVQLDSAKITKNELRALELYKAFTHQHKTENLIELLDIKITDEDIQYLMPLGDGIGDVPPTDEGWAPLTLRALVTETYDKGGVFTKDDVLRIFLPLFKTIEKLNDAGIVHRDIKPDNIIFIKGKAYLTDIGLLREDNYTITCAGTPDFLAPSWYTNSGGKVDMWGLVSTLYFFLSGNNPDTLGRPNYMLPKHKEKMQAEDIKAWQHFNKVILRATREKASERYITYADLIATLENTDKKEFDFSPIPIEYTSRRSSVLWIRGRLGRVQCTGWYLVFFLASVFLGVTADGSSALDPYIQPITLFLRWLTITLLVKRVHDAGRNALWGFGCFAISYLIRFPMSLYVYYFNTPDQISDWGFLLFVAIDFFAGITALALALCFKSEEQANKYGPAHQKLSLF